MSEAFYFPVTNGSSNSNKTSTKLCASQFGKGLEITQKLSVLSCLPTHQLKMVFHFRSPPSVVSYKQAQLLSLSIAA